MRPVHEGRRHGWSRLTAGSATVGGCVVLAMTWALASGAPALAALDVPLPTTTDATNGAAVLPPEPWRSTLPTGATPRSFVTRDSITVDGIQFLARSRGTLVLVHGPGPVDRVLAAWAPRLQAASGLQVIGIALRGFGRSGGTIDSLNDRDGYVEDLGAVVRELKRRMPGGPVIFVAPTAGAGLAIRYVDHSAMASAGARGLRAPDGLVLIEPTLTLDALVADTLGGLTGVAWHRRRLAVQRRLPWFPLMANLPVAHAVVATAEGRAVRHLPFATIQSLRPEGNPWHALARSDVPVLLLSGTSPDSSDFPPAEHRLWQRISRGAPLPDAALAGPLTAWLSRYAGDAEERPSPLPYQLLPILPPR